MADNLKPSESKVGFAAFSTLVSNVDREIAEAQRAVTSAAPATSARSTNPPAVKATAIGRDYAGRADTASTGYAVAARKALPWVGAAVIGIVVLAKIASHMGSGQPPISPVASLASAQHPPAPPPALAAQLQPHSDAPPAPAARPVQSPVAPNPVTLPSTDSAPSWVEDPPDPQTLIALDLPQIRYCVAEKVRMKAMGDTVNLYAHSEVTTFNRYVDDYNARCGHFRYREGDLEFVRRAASGLQNEFETQGRARILSLRKKHPGHKAKPPPTDNPWDAYAPAPPQQGSDDIQGSGTDSSDGQPPDQ